MILQHSVILGAFKMRIIYLKSNAVLMQLTAIRTFYIILSHSEFQVKLVSYITERSKGASITVGK
jgi:hypothetical protein